MMFKAGDWAVLRNDNGGRLFQVGGVWESPTPASDPNFYKVWEAEQPGQPKFEVWNHQLIAVKDKEDALRLVGALDYVRVEYQHKLADLNREKDKAFARARRAYEILDPETGGY